VPSVTPNFITVTVQTIDLPHDGIITRPIFEALPKVSRGWAWELRYGRVTLTHMPMTYWHWQVIVAAIEYWHRLGYARAGEQYVADGRFMRGGPAENNFVADGVVFRLGHMPDLKTGTHDAANLHAVIETVCGDIEERDAIEKYAAYAQLGIANYWIIRERSRLTEDDGQITMYELSGGEYKFVGTRLVSQLKDSGDADQDRQGQQR
jgi:hypothetical protein